LNIEGLAGFGVGVYRLFDYTGSLTDNGLDLGSLPSGFLYAIDTSTSSQVNLNVSAIPEASTMTLSILGAATIAFALRAKRRRGSR
jgi:hypothetical protein